MFEKASRLKIRYSTVKGQLSVEDLWDLKLEDLNLIAKTLSRTLKESEDEDFIKTKSKSNELLELKFEVIKHVITTKLAEKEAKAKALEKAEKKAKLEELISKKEMTALESKTIEELKAELDSL